MSRSEFILVAAPTQAGEQFIRFLKLKGLPFIVVTNNKNEQQRLSQLGVEHFIDIDTVEQSGLFPEYPIGNIFIFENSLSICCRYLQIIRKWTSKAIYVIQESDGPRSFYRWLGADYIICSKTGNVSFLIS